MPVGPISDVFGLMLSASQLEDAVADVLKKWFATYLAEVERQLAIPTSSLPAPTNYLNRDNFIGIKGEELPKLLVISQGLGTTPDFYGSTRTYCATWRLGVGIATAAQEELWANRDVKAYAAAIRAIMLQKVQSEITDFHVAEVAWIAENYNDVMVDNQISLYKSASVHFMIIVDSPVQKWGGPSQPTLAAPAATPDVETVIADLGIVPHNKKLDDSTVEGVEVITEMTVS